MPQANGIEARLRQAASLPEALAAGFDAFEAIRMAARDCQDRVPELFAAFMTTADAAVDGREALTIAPSLPLGGGTEPGAVACRPVPMRVRPPMPWPRSRPCCATSHRCRCPGRHARRPGRLPGGRGAAGRICQLMTR